MAKAATAEPVNSHDPLKYRSWAICIELFVASGATQLLSRSSCPPRRITGRRALSEIALSGRT